MRNYSCTETACIIALIAAAAVTMGSIFAKGISQAAMDAAAYDCIERVE